MSNLDTNSDSHCATTGRNTVLLAYWTAGWLLTMALATFGPIFLWDSNDWLTGLAILLNLAIGVGVILVNKRHLQGLDELQRKIQLDAMALSLGVGLIVGLAYSNLDVANLISADAEISHLVILVALTYLLGVFMGHRKYR